MARKNIHTTFSKTAGNWRNVREGASRPSKVFSTKSEAQAQGRQIAMNSGVEHLIHKKTGPISERNSYGNDNFPPRG